MASENNLNAVFSDIANSIRSKKGTTDAIQPINMADEISTIETGSNEKSAIYQALERMGTNWAYAFEAGSNSKLFENIIEIKAIDFPPVTSVTDTTKMFIGCPNLTTVAQFDTSNVLYMNGMFSNCQNLTSIPLLNTSKVTNMSSMFSNCSKLTTIPQLDTSKVMYMTSMFEQCTALTSIPLLNTSSVLNIG